MFDYFYGQQADQFSFYRVPKVLFTEDCFWNVSTDAKLLYGILLDRMNLSARNNWLDKEGRVYIIFEVMCSNRKMIRIASDDKPVEIVRSTFMKLDSEHIRFVMDRFKENTTEVRNIKQYLLASIYNAPYTIDAHYDAQVRHDMASGKLGGRW